MSDNICPKCKTINAEGSSFCKNCGFSFDNNKTNVDEIKNNLKNFTEDITSKIQNKLEDDDIFKTNYIKEMIKNLDEDSFKKLLDKYDISQSKLKLMDFKKLFDKVDVNKLKEDLIEFGIIPPKNESDTETVKTTVIIEEDDKTEGSEENEVPLIEDNQHDETSKSPESERTPNINVCSKCGFENRSKVKFCTNCGNKL